MKMSTAKIVSSQLPSGIMSKYGSLLCYLLSFMSRPNVYSGMAFKSENDLRLKEYNMNDIDESVLEKFRKFYYYDENNTFLKKEYECDTQYFNNSYLHLVTDKQENVLGSVMVIAYTKPKSLPIEHAVMKDKDGNDFGKFDANDFCKRKLIGANTNHKICEVYRLKKTPYILSKKADVETSFLLLASIIGKFLLKNYRYALITCSRENKGLHNLYLKNLLFKSPGLFAYYPQDTCGWNILTMDFWKQQKVYANYGRKQFATELFFLSHFRRKSFMLESGRLSRPFSLDVSKVNKN
ncbi:hypothetical protein QA601_08425 [Chitinispirillales bacterium ANBcel5]|uniref:hypothetical protein n=1 Tax=Cellulosispirillum alkaliphilum TaxID=3039283 RepID=UPI002A5171CD|nr:hypothetical protein [Chitinispirillales bacterium ANBcel5]